MNLAISFNQAEAGLVSLVGGKGKNLISLTAAGFPVPPGFVVTSESYHLFREGLGWLDRELEQFNHDRPEVLRDQCAGVRQRLQEVDLPPAVQGAIRTALETIGASATDAFAVRSSSTLEDLAQAAFAGQHDTYLNIRGTEAILARVRDCFASLWGDRAVLYRHRQRFSQKDVRMAVVVQRQVECDRAGVGFSLNPVTGRINRLVIDANYGLGESVVSGECEVDHFELDKTTLTILERVIGHKEHVVAPTRNGVEERAVPAELADRSCLTDQQVAGVGELLKRVEDHYGWPQDIEWGWRGGTLYLFQSRPVTTFQPRWTRDESAERFPNPMSPLTWDFIQMAFRKSLPYSLNLMGLPPLQGDWFGRFNNYIYGNQNAVDLIASYRPLRARSPEELVREIPGLRRRYAWVLDLPVRWARDLDRYLLRLGRLSAAALDDADLPAVWQHMTEVLSAGSEYFLPNIAISMTQTFVHRLLHALVAAMAGQDRALTLVDGLLAGCETKTAVVNRELHELAQRAARTPNLAKELLHHGGRGFWELGRIDQFPEFAAPFRRFLEDHGHREMDMDYLHPTWSGQPWIVLDSIALILRSETGEDPAETARRLRLRYAETEHQFLSSVPKELRFFFRELIRMARTYTALDDLEHYQTTRINPVARRAALALGRCLRGRGILDHAEDIFFLGKEDLEDLVSAYPHEDPKAYRRKAYEAKASYEASRTQTPAWSLEDTDAGKDTSDAHTLRGLPGSPGRVTGPCFRVQAPADFARFPKNAILVARTTNPAWTPLFYSALGLITESGGPLSHGAVTAREMRLPAVMSVRGVMTLLSDGQVVTVDGTQGVVRLELT
jgi:pyruvate,water dikinase